MKLLSLFCVLSSSAIAQQSAPAPSPIPAVSSTVVVLGSPSPVAAGDSARAVVALDTQEHPLAFAASEDYLRTDASADIEQRAGAGILADISIRGTTFEQTLVLLNGFRVNNVETSHFNLDIPVPLNALGSVDVLHGAGSTLYGSDALGGVVDFLTLTPQHTDLRLQTGVGSYGENQQAVTASLLTRHFSEVIAGSRALSSGFLEGRDYRTESGSSETRFDTRAGKTDLLFAGDDRSFGANQFFGNFDSRERTKGWFASVAQQVNPHTQLGIAYRRHADIFLLRRTQPAGYKNQHIDSGFQGDLRDTHALPHHFSLSTGLEAITDQIRSTNLGAHGRNRGAGYASVGWLKSESGTISVGAREEVFSGGRTVFSPTIAASRWLTHTLSVRGSLGYGFRLPTFLDLYYNDPATLGNANLRPETAWNYEGGLVWFPRPTIAATLTAFYAPQTDTIDYTRTAPTQKYQATNLSALHFTGVETSFDWKPNVSHHITVSWANLYGTQAALAGQQSRYVFNYATNNGRVQWDWNIRDRWVVQSRLGVVQRFQRDPYALLDLSVVREAGYIHPFLQMTNLTNTGYEEIVGVRQPSRSFIGGVEVVLSHRK